MQRTRTIGRKRIIIFSVISVLFLGVLIAADLVSKAVFENALKEKPVIDVIKDFFYFTFTLNEGSAYGLLSGKSWAQTFFKILTPISLILFIFFYIYAFKKNYKVLLVALMLIIGGTIGNYIDRLLFSAVRDFICLEIGGNRIFGIFNLADAFLSVGVIMVVVHLFFLDESAIFRKKKIEKVVTESIIDDENQKTEIMEEQTVENKSDGNENADI